MQEEISFNGFAEQTKIKYFTTFSGQTSDDDSIYYVIADSNNQPLKLVQSSIETIFGLDPLNYNIPLSSLTFGYTIYTGTVVENIVNQIINQDTRTSISNNYFSYINNQIISGNTSNLPNNEFTCVFFEEQFFNDFNLNVKINRSIETLNTLNIYNLPINEITTFTNDTGVLFGKIEAIQVLLDDEGNKIRIPLNKVTVGIFNPSDEIPSVGSVDENGNRIRLNLYENLETINDVNNLQSYASFQSYLTDVQNSPTDLQNSFIPAKYKYTTITNEEGEFILHNIPIGQQTLMVEVDLLKQGLDPEEVALNFFPYSVLDDPNVSEIPHLYFNQFPINIVPSWGEFQTGYTQINLAIVLDLRKWITFFTYPIASIVSNLAEISNAPQDNLPKTLDELFLEGNKNPFLVEIRDMTKPFSIENRPKVELVKIIDILDKNIDLNCAWNQEFKIRANKIEYTTSAFNAFKLPANLYDPYGINTKGQRGVWVGAYQIKNSFPSPELSFHATGYDRNWLPDGTPTQANHFDLTRYDGWTDLGSSPTPGAGIGQKPYEKPWSLTYPAPFVLSKKPTIKNPLKSFDFFGNPLLSPVVIDNNGVSRTYNLTPGEFFLQPRYLDGDLVGGPDSWNTNANGYGLQNYFGVWYGNDFSRQVTKNETWRYEGGHHWGLDWSNGFNSYFTPVDYNKYPQAPSGKPEIRGDFFQRVEAGYAYWLKPPTWPRIKNESWGDHLLDDDYLTYAPHVDNSVYNGYFSYYPSTYTYLEEIHTVMGSRSPWYSKEGCLDIYRIEKPYYTNPPKLPFTPKFAEFLIEQVIFDQSLGNQDDNKKCKARTCDAGGFLSGDKVNCQIWLALGDLNQDPSKDFRQNCEIRFTDRGGRDGLMPKGNIKNIGTTKVTINGQVLTPSQGSKFEFTVQGYPKGIYDPNKILLPANDKYNPRTNSYEGASYLFDFGSILLPRDISGYGGIALPVYKYAVGVQDTPTRYWLTSMIPREVGLGSSKCASVRDQNTRAGVFNFNTFGELVDGVVSAVFINFLVLNPVIGPLIFALNKQLIIDSFNDIRELFNEDSEAYNSGFRKSNNIGVFINGINYCVRNGGGYNCDQNYGPAHFNARGFLPYVGPETEEARRLNLRSDVPIYGASWANDFGNRLVGGAGQSVFQPRRMYENNLKGQGPYLPYFCELFFQGVSFDYSKAF